MEYLVKRYQNGKLYDTISHCYIKVEELIQLKNDSEKVLVVIDNKSKKDITKASLVEAFCRTNSASVCYDLLFSNKDTVK